MFTDPHTIVVCRLCEHPLGADAQKDRVPDSNSSGAQLILFKDISPNTASVNLRADPLAQVCTFCLGMRKIEEGKRAAEVDTIRAENEILKKEASFIESQTFKENVKSLLLIARFFVMLFFLIWSMLYGPPFLTSFFSPEKVEQGKKKSVERAFLKDKNQNRRKRSSLSEPQGSSPETIILYSQLVPGLRHAVSFLISHCSSMLSRYMYKRSLTGGKQSAYCRMQYNTIRQYLTNSIAGRGHNTLLRCCV